MSKTTDTIPDTSFRFLGATALIQEVSSISLVGAQFDPEGSVSMSLEDFEKLAIALLDQRGAIRLHEVAK